MREREVKLTVPQGAELPPAEALIDGLGTWSVEDIDQRATYFDTHDLALTRAGASVRYRSDDGWTVKIPHPRDKATFVRDEYRFPGTEGDPPAAAVDLVQAWTRSRSLNEVARIHTQRRAIRVVDKRHRPVVEIDEDNVVATDHAGRESRFREVEVESVGTDRPGVVAVLVVRLRAAGAGGAEPMPKIARALGEQASAPPDMSAPRAIDKSATLGQLIRRSIAAGGRQLIESDPIVRVGEDPEGVHRARVATRRLRSDLRTFRPLLDPEWTESLRSELQWLGLLLGQVRDADVLLAHLGEKRRCVTDEERADVDALIARLQDARGRHRNMLLEAMRSDRYALMLDRLVGAVRSPRLKPGVNERAARRDVPKLTRRPVRRLRKHIRQLPDNPASTDLHEARKRAKQARYALEAAAPVVGKRAARQARRLADLQGVLGDYQDTIFADGWLRDAARDPVRSDIAFAAGRVACSFDAERAHLRKRWPTAWKRANRIL